jgi:hypothetical protein
MAADLTKVTDENKRLRVLITNVWLDLRSGTECVVRDLALGLLARGHRPIVYSPLLGTIAEEIQQRGVPTIDDLAKIGEAPDVIHGHHFVPTGEAIIHFPAVPVFFIGHSWRYWVETPPRFPQIRQYAGVDEGCRDRMVDVEGIPADRVMLLHNAVDLARVPLRSRALEKRPLRALAFSKFSSHLPILRAACERAGLKYAELGLGADRMVSHPEKELAGHDIVFATARCALEAACGGSAVICGDERGLGGLVTSSNFAQFRRNNFGLRSLTRDLNVEAVLDEIRKYDRDDAIAVSARAREEADFTKWIGTVEEIYYRIIDETRRAPVNEGAYREALLQFLQKALPRTQVPPPWLIEHPEAKRRNLDRQCTAARQEAAAARNEVNQLRRSRILRFSQALRRRLGLPHMPGM